MPKHTEYLSTLCLQLARRGDVKRAGRDHHSWWQDVFCYCLGSQSRRAFNSDSNQLLLGVSYDWLPNVPKYNSRGYNKKLRTALHEAFTNLQKVSVGIEQVIWDQQEQNGAFIDGFKALEDYLMLVLCEVSTTLFEVGLDRPNNLLRTHMPNNLRCNLDQSTRNSRDFIIMREAYNLFGYIRDEFDDWANIIMAHDR
ncbi:hypothetical protein JTB14_025305 [Gonioctena quinquepunctata]|nr:hypothetical protein JTB14_025305 [Gonioctena quinquepunctata]